MKLFWSGGSPYARKCMLVAHEIGLADRVELIDGSGTPVSPNAQTVAYNPLGKLPCLVPDDAPAIFDSRVICQYLIAQVPAQTLLANDGAQRFASLTLEALADGICDAAILIRYETVLREEAVRSQAWLDAQMRKIDSALDALEQRWQSHIAAPFDLGQAALGCALGYLDFRYSDKDWRSTHPGLARWSERFAGRDSAIATAPRDA